MAGFAKDNNNGGSIYYDGNGNVGTLGNAEEPLVINELPKVIDTYLVADAKEYIEAESKVVFPTIEEIRKLDPNHIFTKERGFAPGDPRRCRGHRFGPREGFHQMEKEYRILGFVSEALENPKDVTVEEKKPVKVDDFKKIMDECLENRE